MDICVSSYEFRSENYLTLEVLSGDAWICRPKNGNHLQGGRKFGLIGVSRSAFIIKFQAKNSCEQRRDHLYPHEQL